MKAYREASVQCARSGGVRLGAKSNVFAIATDIEDGAIEAITTDSEDGAIELILIDTEDR